ncbi:T9SS type A sorting domain-containing protein [Christiangramia aestuarii]|nr:T9SS type A sorting domain-containing protein [Christiangramia aestuarii]
MKLPLLFLLIFGTTGLYAQLYLSPSTESDTYIYAKDRLVYVKEQIELVKNNKKETEASIYLRKNSELIQGRTGSNGNRGTGLISVFQKGTSNAYDYNYWGVPVNISTKNSRLNDLIFDPINQTESRTANLIGSLEGSSSPLSISNRWIYTFSGTNYSNWLYAGDIFDLLPGEGFTMKGVNGSNLNTIESESINPGNAQIYDFRGLPNDGLIELPIKKDQILLVGNPYPSSLDLDKFLIENTSTTGIAYFWDSKENGNSHYLADYEGGYGTYSPGTGIYIPPAFKKYSDGTDTGQTGKYYDRKLIPVAQGFMLIGNKNGLLKFQNSQRSYPWNRTNLPVFKTQASAMESLNLDIEINETYLQKLALVFKTESTPEEDHAMDARKMDSYPKDISWSIANTAYVINVRPRKDQELIPLKISLADKAELKFYISDLNNFNPERIFIYDARKELYYSIKTGYLKLSLDKGEYQDWFYLSFIEKIQETTNPDSPDSTRIEKPENILLNTIDIFQNNGGQQLEVKMLYDANLSRIRLYDLNGKQFLDKNFKMPEKEFNFPTGNLSNAVYIVKVNTSDHKELTKKIGVKN